MDLKSRILGGIHGLIVGDCLGVPYEFRKPEVIPSFSEIEFTPPYYFDRAYKNIKPGTWSDDSAQMLCLLDSLIETGDFDLNNFSDKLLDWYSNGLWAVDNFVFDCGIQTSLSLDCYNNGISAEKAGFANPYGKGNGALMRVLPLSLLNHQNKDKLILDSHKQCLITHGHICNQVCCALYSLWNSYLFESESIKESYEKAVNYLITFYSKSHFEEYKMELEYLLKDGNFSGSGFVIDSIRSVRYLLFNYDNFESVVKQAVMLGNDTDTTAAIAGGLAGTFYGFESIPKRFIQEIRGKELLSSIIGKLSEVMELN